MWCYRIFSRNLKSVAKHKVEHIEKHLPAACPSGQSMILDGEVLLIDTHTGYAGPLTCDRVCSIRITHFCDYLSPCSLPLPFGSLGKHKKEHFKDATVCLFIFDIIYFNGTHTCIN